MTLTKQQKIEKLREIIVKEIPEILELKEGCIFEWQNNDFEYRKHLITRATGTECVLRGVQGFCLYAVNIKEQEVYSFDEPFDYEEEGGSFYDYAVIIGRPITLEDVLIVLTQVGGSRWDLITYKKPRLRNTIKILREDLDYFLNWEKGKPLHEQPELVLDYLLKVLDK